MNQFATWALGLFLVLGLSCSEKLTNEVPYPEGYRSWTHVKTLTLKEKHPLYASFGGIHHVYVNPTGRDALLSKSVYPDGSILVFDLLESDANEEVASEGKRKVLAVMYKNSKAFPETKGWGFEGFKGNTKDRLVNRNHASCFGCHANQSATDYTFSEYRE